MLGHIDLKMRAIPNWSLGFHHQPFDSCVDGFRSPISSIGHLWLQRPSNSEIRRGPFYVFTCIPFGCFEFLTDGHCVSMVAPVLILGIQQLVLKSASREDDPNFIWVVWLWFWPKLRQSGVRMLALGLAASKGGKGGLPKNGYKTWYETLQGNREK